MLPSQPTRSEGAHALLHRLEKTKRALDKANAKLVEELSKSVAAADSEAKIVKLEEAAARASMDVAKAKERRVAEELKKKMFSAEKAKKDEEKELRRKAAEAENEEKKKVLEA